LEVQDHREQLRELIEVRARVMKSLNERSMEDRQSRIPVRLVVGLLTSPPHLSAFDERQMDHDEAHPVAPSKTTGNGASHQARDRGRLPRRGWWSCGRGTVVLGLARLVGWRGWWPGGAGYFAHPGGNMVGVGGAQAAPPATWF